MNFDTFISALLLSAGYNATVVTIGAALLGAWAGCTGTYLLLRKRSLVSDAISHATLPGICLAFLIMTALGGDGRWLLGLLAGAAATAALGLASADALVRRTRLAEDAAIGAVLSVFFGIGILLLTVIQTLSAGRQAGLGSFLLGATAGMLLRDALLIAAGCAIGMVALLALARPLTIVCFDAEHAAVMGIDIRKMDRALLAMALAVTVVGMTVVGLVLIVALMIIPPVAARFWTNRADHMVAIAAAIGAVSGYVGTALSASAHNLPTGPVVVLVAVAIFVVSIVVSPAGGLLASALRQWRYRQRVHERQGLLAIARGEPLLDPETRTAMRRRGYVRADGVATLQGLGVAALALRDEARWEVWRRRDPSLTVLGRYDGLTPITELLTADEIADLDRDLAPQLVT